MTTPNHTPTPDNYVELAVEREFLNVRPRTAGKNTETIAALTARVAELEAALREIKKERQYAGPDTLSQIPTKAAEIARAALAKGA